MTQSENKNMFDTSHPYAILSGFLILPALSSTMTMFLSIFLVVNSNPSQLSGMNLFTYILHVIFIPYLFICAFYWFKRKRILPKLMSIFFASQTLISVWFMVSGVENEFMNVSINLIWTIYFIVSRRVKETFIY